MPVNEPEAPVEDLRRQIEDLKAEQRRLREEQEQLRNDPHQGNGHGNSNGGGEQQKNPPEQPGNQQGQNQQGQSQPPAKPPLRKRAGAWVARHPLGTVMLALAFVVLIIAGLVLWNYLESYETTDDAQIDGHINPVSSRVRGTVVAVYVENDRPVVAGQSLVDLDPRDYQVAVEQARGAYAQAIGQLNAENPNVPIVVTTSATTISTSQSDVLVAQKAVSAAEGQLAAAEASLAQAEAQNVKAQRDVERFQPLVAKEEISRQQFDAYVATARTQAAAVDAARANVEVARQTLDQRQAQLTAAQTRLNEAQKNAPRQLAARRADVESRKANVQAAKAALDQAILNLSYTKIVAPVSGIVTNKTVEKGQQIQAGEQLLSISQIADVWVTANFKETELRRMRAGQSVDIHVDAFNQTYHGYLEELPGATGAVTSLLPPENATGNYVKVVQRLPVRIRFKPGEDRDQRLRIGMSVEPKVWLYSNTR